MDHVRLTAVCVQLAGYPARSLQLTGNICVALNSCDQ